MAHGVTKYLNPSPATAKGHMKRPRQGIRSTRWVPNVPSQPVAHVKDHLAHSSADTPDNNDTVSSDIIRVHDTHANIIEDDNKSDGGNVFVFAAFADKRDVTLYSDLTGVFPFMSLEEMFVSSSYTTTNQTQSWLSPSQTLQMNLSSRHIKPNSSYLKQRDIKFN
jgi:hypothetical protein